MEHDKVIFIVCLVTLVIQTLFFTLAVTWLTRETEKTLERCRDCFSRAFDIVEEFMRLQLHCADIDDSEVENDEEENT